MSATLIDLQERLADRLGRRAAPSSPELPLRPLPQPLRRRPES